MISLGIHGQIIVPDDDSRLNNESFGPEHLEGFWKLPPHAADDITLTLAKLYRRMTPSTRRVFIDLGNDDKEFKALIDKCFFNYAAFGHPDVNDWPDPPDKDIVEREFLTGLEIVMIFTQVDGRRMVEVQNPVGQKYMTYEEFRLFYATSVGEYLRARLEIITTRVKAALELCKPGEPIEYNIQYITHDAVVGRMMVKAYSEKSLQRWAKRLHYTILELSTRQSTAPK